MKKAKDEKKALPNSFEENKEPLHCPCCREGSLHRLKPCRTFTKDPDDGWGFDRDMTYLCACQSCNREDIRLVIGIRKGVLQFGFEYGDLPVI